MINLSPAELLSPIRQWMVDFERESKDVGSGFWDNDKDQMSIAMRRFESDPCADTWNMVIEKLGQLIAFPMAMGGIDNPGDSNRFFMEAFASPDLPR